MPRKTIVSQSSSLDKADTVAGIQADLGLVRTVETKDGDRDLLTAVELGRRAGLPGKWGVKGHNLNIIAESLGLIRRHNGRWVPVDGENSPHMKKIDGRWRWHTTAVGIIESAAQSFDWTPPKGSRA